MGKSTSSSPKKLKKHKQGLFERLHSELKRKKGAGIIYLILRAFVIASFIFEVIQGKYENAMLCVLTLILFLAPTFVEDTFKIDFPSFFEVVIMLFIFSAEILGEIRAFYLRVPGWDTMLHTLNGFNCAAVGFCLVDFFNRNQHFSMKMSPMYLAISSFCFSMTVGVLWEFFEFSMDYFLLYDTQKDFVINTLSTVTLNPDGLNKAVVIKDITDVIVVQSDGTQIPLGLGGYLDVGIIDTMKDLFVNFIGAVVFSVIGAIYVKNRDKNDLAAKITGQFIPIVQDDDINSLEEVQEEKKQESSEEK